MFCGSYYLLPTLETFFLGRFWRETIQSNLTLRRSQRIKVGRWGYARTRCCAGAGSSSMGLRRGSNSSRSKCQQESTCKETREESSNKFGHTQILSSITLCEKLYSVFWKFEGFCQN